MGIFGGQTDNLQLEENLGNEENPMAKGRILGSNLNSMLKDKQQLFPIDPRLRLKACGG